MNQWKPYNHSRWLIDVCREHIKLLRGSSKYLGVKLGSPRVYHGKYYYHILVCEQERPRQHK